MSTYPALFIVTIAEATIGVFVKLTGDAVPLLALNFYRVLFALTFLAIVTSFTSGRSWRVPRSNLRDIGIVGVLIAAQISFFNVAMTLAPIANVVIFWSVAPFFVFIFSTIFLQERVRKHHVFIFLIALAGIVLAKPLSGGHMAGNLIALADGAIYAAMVTYLRHEANTETSNDIFWFMGAATLILLPGIFISGPGHIFQMLSYPALGVQVPVIMWPVMLGVVSTGMAYYFISVVLNTINANIYSLVDVIFSPLVAALFGYLIFSEVPDPNLIYGGALLLFAGFLITRYMTHSRHDQLPAVPTQR